MTPMEDKVLRRFDTLKTAAAVKSTNLEFRLSPTITALQPSVGFESDQTLITESLLETLSTDFAHALKSLSLTLADLKRLSALGSLPISLTSTPKGPVLSIRFRGCDATTVTLLCEELGVCNGIVREDAEWDDSREVEMALLFPFAPTTAEEDSVASFFDQKVERTLTARSPLEWQGMMTPSTDMHTPSSTVSYDHIAHSRQLPAGISSPSGYESMHYSDYGEDYDPYIGSEARQPAYSGRGEDLDGLEGIYRFLRECEDARRR